VVVVDLAVVVGVFVTKVDERTVVETGEVMKTVVRGLV